MDRSMKVFAVVFLLLVATGFQGAVQVALARDCTSQSHKFVGLCLSDRNCASVCLTEYFTGGKCDHRRCVCTKGC
ncbi:Defensin Tk-AMP-D4 [Triticum urartu]|nr:defensin Tk-AMP-D4 [Triticum dicoccoides]XP_044426955.1 defensin Tk-AMP-D4 [Triticum aestivum]XP_048544170.1 defensin Tk-AMP-D4 [Triticum urartu]AIA67008.1 defensin [Triticum aestivum]EMS54457.1 Defensin Tk-AMP-D4 [Triticum urartu]